VACAEVMAGYHGACSRANTRVCPWAWPDVAQGAVLELYVVVQVHECVVTKHYATLAVAAAGAGEVVGHQGVALRAVLVRLGAWPDVCPRTGMLP
jgi:hypothetical protein